MLFQVYTNGNPYGIAEDIVFSMPCRSNVSLRLICLYFFMLELVLLLTLLSSVKGDGDYELVKDVIFDDYLRQRIAKVNV